MENESFLEEFKKYLANPKSRLLILTGVAIFSIVAIVLVFVVINSKNIGNEIAEAKKIEDNPVQKANLLSQIIKNNPKTSVNPNLGTNPNRTNEQQFRGVSGYAAIDPVTGLLINSTENNLLAVGPNEQPDLTKYNYRKTTETITEGVISSSCNFGYSNLKTSRFVSAEYFDSNNSYYVRNSQYDDGSLKSFTNSHTNPNINETYSYAGGDYAVTQKYKSYWNTYSTDKPSSYAIPTYVSLPVSFPEAANIIQSYFGGNTTVQRVYQEANRTFYEIVSTYSVNCLDNATEAITPYLDENGAVKFITVNTIDAANFEISRSKTYINNIAPDKLVYARDFKVEYKLTSFDTVSSEFENYPAPEIKIVDWRDYHFTKEAYKEYLLGPLRDGGYESILPSQNFRISYLYGKNLPPSGVKGADFYKNRNYYSPGERGEATYQEVMKHYGPENPLLSYTVATRNGYNMFDYNQYEASADKEKIIGYFNEYSPFGSTEFTRQIEINGEIIDVELKQFISSSYNYPTSYPVSYVESLSDRFPTISEVSYPTSFPFQSHFYVYYRFHFEYKGILYTGNVEGWAIDRFLNEPMVNIRWDDPSQERSNITDPAINGGFYGGGGYHWYQYY